MNDPTSRNEQDTVELERALTRVCLGETMGADDVDLLGDKADTWDLYRTMVRTRLWDMTAAALPRSLSCMGEVAMHKSFEHYLSNTPPITRFIREVPCEFAQVLLHKYERQRKEHLESYGACMLERDLVHYESLLWRLADEEVAWPTNQELAAFDFEKKPNLNPTLHIEEYAFEVDRKTVEQLRTEPPRPTIYLAIFRHPETHRVKTWNINELSCAILRAWQSTELSAAESIQQLMQLQGNAITKSFLEGFSDLLTRWLQAKLILGSHAS